MSFLEVNELVRHFGAVKAVDGLTFTLERGQSVGLIGANGAGKTTMMRLLTTLDLPDSGSITLDGVDAVTSPELVRSRIGWMPDEFTPIPHMTVRDTIDFFARAYGLTGSHRLAEVERVLAFCGISELADRFINRISKGQAQRVALARTIIGNPDLLVLDEPAAGLDPASRLEFMQFVRALQREGKTLLISSHILSELAEMCDTMLFMDAGRLIRSGTLAELNSDEGLRFRIETAGSPAALADWLKAREGWSRVQVEDEGNSLRAHFTLPAGKDEGEALALELRAMAAEHMVTGFIRSRRRLEETFVSILQERKN